MAISALAASAFAQGTVTLGNQTGFVKQWTSTSDSTLINVPKSGGYVQLIAAPKGTALANPLITYDGTGHAVTHYSSLAGFLAANPGWALPANSAGAGTPGLIALSSGLFASGNYTIQNITEAASADYFLLSWTGAFTSIDLAMAAAAGNASASFLGESGIATTATASPFGTPSPPTPVNTRSTFAGMTLAPVGIIPEPSTFALAGIGAAALMIFRRRK